MRCVLLGNYGVGNIGDEALRQYFLDAFPDMTWTVVTAHPRSRGEVPRLPFGIRSFFKPWWQTMLAISVSDAVIFGGGTMFTDCESVFACILWWWHGLCVRLIGVPVFLASQGVGPFRTRLGLSLARATFESAAFVSVRDEASLHRVKAWNLSAEPVLTFDPVFALFSRTKQIPQSKKILAVIPRGNSDDQFFVELSSALLKPFDEVRILLLQPDAQENAIAERIKKITHIPCVIVPILTADQLVTHIAGATAVLSQRYHGALAALAIGVPVTIVPQSDGDKLDTLRNVQRDPATLAGLQSLMKRGEGALRSALLSV